MTKVTVTADVLVWGDGGRGSLSFEDDEGEDEDDADDDDLDVACRISIWLPSTGHEQFLQ